MASYSDELSLLAREWLAETGWQFRSQTTSTALAQGRYHLVTKEMSDGHRVVLLAFPGTENAKDAKVDLRTRSVPFGGSSVEEFHAIAQQDRHATSYPLVHKGFDDYTMTALFYEPAYEPVDSAGDETGKTMGEHLAQELRAHPTEVLYLTGHSLGGATARHHVRLTGCRQCGFCKVLREAHAAHAHRHGWRSCGGGIAVARHALRAVRRARGVEAGSQLGALRARDGCLSRQSLAPLLQRG